jgi:hypothetical protein
MKWFIWREYAGRIKWEWMTKRIDENWQYAKKEHEKRVISVKKE